MKLLRVVMQVRMVSVCPCYIWCQSVRVIFDVSLSVLYLMSVCPCYIRCQSVRVILDVSLSVLYLMSVCPCYIWCQSVRLPYSVIYYIVIFFYFILSYNIILHSINFFLILGLRKECILLNENLIFDGIGNGVLQLKIR